MEDAHSLHFKLTTDAALTLPGGRIVKKYRKGRARHTKRVETYFDTPRLVLKKRRIEFKVSQAGGHRVQEVIAHTGGSEPRHWRVELPDETPPGLGRIDSFPRELRSGLWDASLQPAFSSYIDRTTSSLRAGQVRSPCLK